MKLKVKIMERKFELKNNLLYPNLQKWATEVIESIENDELLVFNPNDKNALKYIKDEQGYTVLNTRAKTPVSIKEWLPVGCQCIRYKDRESDGKAGEKEAACYSHNGAKVLWPEYAEWEPEGPAAFVGEILFSPRTREEVIFKDDVVSECKFKCIFAHELVHVFDMMRYVVPAFMNWRMFWR